MNGWKLIASGTIFSAALACGIGFAVNATAWAQSEATFGTIPDRAYSDTGEINLDLVPDFIVALDRNGDAVGYVRKSDLFNPARPGSSSQEVFASDGKTILGDMVPGYGFVRSGADLSDVTPFEVTFGPATG